MYIKYIASSNFHYNSDHIVLSLTKTEMAECFGVIHKLSHHRGGLLQWRQVDFNGGIFEIDDIIIKYIASSNFHYNSYYRDKNRDGGMLWGHPYIKSSQRGIASMMTSGL